MPTQTASRGKDTFPQGPRKANRVELNVSSGFATRANLRIFRKECKSGAGKNPEQGRSFPGKKTRHTGPPPGSSAEIPKAGVTARERNHWADSHQNPPRWVRDSRLKQVACETHFNGLIRVGCAPACHLGDRRKLNWVGFVWTELPSPSDEARVGLILPVVSCEGAGFACFSRRANTEAEFTPPLQVSVNLKWPRNSSLGGGFSTLEILGNSSPLAGSYLKIPTRRGPIVHGQNFKDCLDENPFTAAEGTLQLGLLAR